METYSIRVIGDRIVGDNEKGYIVKVLSGGNGGDNRPKRRLRILIPLTTRQKVVIWLLRQGLTQREAAESLGISRRTIHHHLVAIRKKATIRWD